MAQPKRARRESPSDAGDLAPTSGVWEAGRALCEADRTRLIGEICSLIREGRLPKDMHEVGLALIGRLARRMPGEPAHALGVDEARGEATQARRRR